MATKSEVTPLIADTGGPPDDKMKVLGFEVIADDDAWQWCFVFPNVNDENKEKLTQQLSEQLTAAEVKKRAGKIFKDKAKKYVSYSCNNSEVQALFAKAMTVRDFHEAVRKVFLDLLQGEKCGFKTLTKLSIDKDEKLLLLELPPKGEAIVAIADRLEHRMQFKPEAYPDMDPEIEADKGENNKIKSCPTEKYSGGRFDGTAAKLPVYARFDKNLVFNRGDPASAVPPKKVLEDSKFQEFRDIDAMRLAIGRIREFVSVQGMLGEGVLLQFFPVHHEKGRNESDQVGLQGLHESGWSKWNAFFSFYCGQLCRGDEPCKTQMRNYFGEEVTFFFHFYNALNVWLFIPALVSIPVFFREDVFDFETSRCVQVVFSFFIILWAAIFVAKYKQNSNFKCLKWGMFNYASVAQVKRSFRLEKRWTFAEFLQNSSHWLLAIIFLCETLGFVAWCNDFRMGAARAAEKNETVSLLGLATLPGATGVKLGKYLITINIKVVNIMWAILSPMLTTWENRRTDAHSKDAKVTKLFIVKSIVYYYPFVYIAFIKEHIEGCVDKERGCVPELKENLIIFFGTHVATTLFTVSLYVFMTWFSIRSEFNAAKKKNAKAEYSYVQAQAKCPPYVDDTDDFMDLVLSFGFILMFSCVLPVMAFMFFLMNMVEMRLLAFRTAHVNQRAFPQGQEGIGAWFFIVKGLVYLGVIVNVGMACFVMHPINKRPLKQRVLIFVILEHLMMVFIGLIEANIDDKIPVQIAAEERNESIMDEILGDEDKPIRISDAALLNNKSDASLKWD